MQLVWRRIFTRLPDRGYAFLLLVIVGLAALGSINFSAPSSVILAGEIAPRDVVAEQSFLFEDKQATAARKKALRQSHPLICDQIIAPEELFHREVRQLFIDINKAATDEDRQALRQRLQEALNEDITLESIAALAEPRVQDLFLNRVMPNIEQQLREGVLPDMRMVLPYKEGGLIIRSITSGEERVLQDVYSVPDLKALELSISRAIRELPVPSPAKKLFALAVSRYLRPTIAPNYDLTNKSIAQLEQSSEPIMHLVQRGELIIRQGQKVTKEQQIKMQGLLKEQKKRFNTQRFLGIALCGAMLSLGLLVSPCRLKLPPVTRRDFIFIGSLLFVFSLLPLAIMVISNKLTAVSPTFTPESLVYAVPTAGAAALFALVLPIRSHILAGLMLAFFCTVMSQAGVGLFIFYLLGGLLNASLTLHTSTRRAFVKNFVPLTLGMFTLWLATTLLDGGSSNRFVTEAFCIGIGSFFSMTLLFALAPIAESVFGYTTRFRLMELMNLEQPILRELMLNAPGTYHHSLIVANMVEAAADAVGANSLLCKVAALYHDIGKIAKAQYFIENQFNTSNPHDRITPSMSALILISHTKQGEELGMQHRLGPEVTDIIRQHHGTSVIRYFYQKALALNEAIPPKEEDFRYPGPKPQTREAGIVMLADVTEASSRALHDPTHGKLRAHIDTMLKKVYSEGQLDETDLTFRDIDIIGENFHKVLRGMFHQRIAYPSQSGSAPLTTTEPATPATPAPKA